MAIFSVSKNLLSVRQQIAPYTPNIIAVTKYYDKNAIVEAYNAGLRDFAESRANEAIDKIQGLPDEVRINSKFHFIGHLQTNKAEKVVKYFDYIQSVDSVKLLKVISKAAKNINKVQKILLQVNISKEEQKFGFNKDELYKNFNEILKIDNIEICGVMCMAPFGASENELDMVFGQAFLLKEELNKKYSVDLKELSMGMSDDFERAVVNGATMIRLGRKLFE